MDYSQFDTHGPRPSSRGTFDERKRRPGYANAILPPDVCCDSHHAAMGKTDNGRA